ncbi:regulatory iron-sulfur-containing complex subunit RicT [uncultured Gimesia sp.]|uniref:PSP1 domain-containing protein n=1 Tax=uncultured Gimesia sp. TaxID=1678688 RepID=UPI0030D773BC|tara:strand:+ start:21940 stop:22791 length:852 start_codon:yes stop_codon:yes gene_type:complete
MNTEVSAYIVRYGSTRLIGEFTFKGQPELPRNASVLIKSDRGQEWGEILSPATERVRSFMKTSEPAGRIIRSVTDDDYRTRDKNRHEERNQFQGCQELVNEHKLQMQLVDVEHLFGGERVIFYYLAEKRVDFRELVKALARKYRSRIEMRQIGVRDEAKLLADYGDCGKPVCCGTHLTEMPPVSMKMAKLQKTSLDPNKLSGRCGRLKCCLRYEYDTYKDYKKELPPIGSTVITKQGEGKVTNQEILSECVQVVYPDSRKTIVHRKEILEVIKKKKGETPTNQ